MVRSVRFVIKEGDIFVYCASFNVDGTRGDDGEWTLMRKMDIRYLVIKEN